MAMNPLAAIIARGRGNNAPPAGSNPDLTGGPDYASRRTAEQRASDSAPGGPEGDASGEGGYGGVNLGPWGSRALSLAALATPGYAGLGLGAIQAGLRGVNTFNSDQINRGLGGPGLNFGQWVGGVFGGNNEGGLAGNRTIANRDGLPAAPGTAVTLGGIYDDDPLGGFDPFGFFSDPRTSLTPAEYVARRNTNPAFNPTTAAAMRAAGNNSFGGGNPNTAQAYGMVPGKVGNFGPAIVSGNDNPVQLGDKQMLAVQQNSNGNKGNAGGASVGGSDHAGQSMGNTSNASGYGNAGGAGIGGVSGHDTSAVGASGQLGHIARGGFIPGNAAIEGDNHLMATTPGEFVVNRPAAAAAGPRLLQALNNPRMAAVLQQAARSRGLLGRAA